MAGLAAALARAWAAGRSGNLVDRRAAAQSVPESRSPTGATFEDVDGRGVEATHPGNSKPR